MYRKKINTTQKEHSMFEPTQNTEAYNEMTRPREYISFFYDETVTPRDTITFFQIDGLVVPVAETITFANISELEAVVHKYLQSEETEFISKESGYLGSEIRFRFDASTNTVTGSVLGEFAFESIGKSSGGSFGLSIGDTVENLFEYSALVDDVASIGVTAPVSYGSANLASSNEYNFFNAWFDIGSEVSCPSIDYCEFKTVSNGVIIKVYAKFGETIVSENANGDVTTLTMTGKSALGVTNA
jgi:hypothetical protein